MSYYDPKKRQLICSKGFARASGLLETHSIKREWMILQDNGWLIKMVELKSIKKSIKNKKIKIVKGWAFKYPYSKHWNFASEQAVPKKPTWETQYPLYEATFKINICKKQENDWKILNGLNSKNKFSLNYPNFDL